VAGQAGEIVLLLARAERLIARRLAGVLDAERLSMGAWRVLTLLSDGVGHPMAEVADFAMLPPGTLTKLMDQLVEENLVYRRIDPVDRRRIRAFLTRRGLETYRRINDDVESAVSDLDTGDLSSGLTRLIATLESAPTAAGLPASL
jgi:MarR family transcriptional regulator, organic hydroperoxide resistance regulator